MNEFSKKIIVLATLGMMSAATQAGDVKGTVVDDMGPLPACDVLIYQQGSTTLFKNEMTDDNGEFEFTNLPNGKYNVVVEYMGYQKKTIDIALTDSKPNIKSMKIKMQDDTKMLKQVVITGQRTALKVDADKKTFLVNANAVTEGVSISDVLKEVPSVNVDVEGNVSLRNNENVIIYINGKPAGLNDDNRGDILEQLPANSIEKVEVITNPSSKYNAEGQAGIINIVLKEGNRKGYYGSVTAGLNIPEDGKIGENVGASISYTNEKWDLNASTGYQNRNMVGGRDRNRTMFKDGDTTFTHTMSENDRKMQTGFLNLGATYHFNKWNSLGVSTLGSLSNRKFDEKYKYEYGEIENGERTTNSYATSDNWTENDRKAFNASMTYDHKFKKEGESLNMSASYATNDVDRESEYVMENQDKDRNKIEGSGKIQNEDQKRKMNQYTFQADYTLPTNKSGKIEIGAKADLKKDENNAHTKEKNETATDYSERSSLSNEFEIQQNIYAGYITYSDKLTKRLKYNIGLRGELTDMYWTQHTTGEKSKRDPYFKLFPSAFISYNVTNDDEFQLNYTRRVSRPNMRRLNPYINVSDSTNISFGNPDLDPEMTHAVELNYVKSNNGNLYTSSIYYKYTEDVTSQYNWTEGQILKTTFGNMSHSQEVGVELIAKQKICKNFTLTGNVNLYYYKLAGGTFDINVRNQDNSIVKQSVYLKSNESLSWTWKLNADVILPWDMSLQASANYSSPRAMSQGKIHHMFGTNAALKRPFFNRKLNVSISCRDIFGTENFRSHTYSSSFSQENKFWRSGRTFLINLSYDFGNMGKQKNKNKFEEKNEEDEISFFDIKNKFTLMDYEDEDSGLF